MSLAPDIGDRAPDLQLLTASGAPLALSELWKQQPLVLLLMRHLG